LPAIEEFKGNENLRRVGTLGVKMGMTTMYNRWGETIPITIILLDRVQVVQIKPPAEGNTFYQVQMGFGSKRLKKLNKSEIGHFMKAKVPPK
jgi:large subunit ribosomal protein L3